MLLLCVQTVFVIGQNKFVFLSWSNENTAVLAGPRHPSLFSTASFSWTDLLSILGLIWSKPLPCPSTIVSSTNALLSPATRCFFSICTVNELKMMSLAHVINILIGLATCQQFNSNPAPISGY